MMLASSVLISLLVVVIVYGAYGAPSTPPIGVPSTADHVKDLSDVNYNDSRGFAVQQVHVVFRHGQRTPADTYPTDPLINETFAPYGWGQLTNYGKQTLYNLGYWLRDRYGKLLGPLYSPDILHAQSTGVTRTQMSIELVLASLFPPQGTALEWNRMLNWQPVPFISEPLDQDTLLLVRTSCPRYHEALNAVLESPEIQNIMNDNQDLFNNLTTLTGMDIRTPDDVQSLYSTLKAESDFNLTLPEWTQDYYPEKLLPLTRLSYILNVYNDELKKLKGGPFLKKAFGEWDAVIANKPNTKNKKMFLYAGHDSSVVNILSAFNVWQEQFPDYAIMASVELHKHRTSGEFAVRIMQKNVKEEPFVLKIPGCTTFCPVEQLKALLASHIPVDMIQDCKAHTAGFEEPPPKGP